MLIINNSSQLKAICEELRHEPVLSIDTEFIRRYTFFAKLSLIQIVSDNHHIIIDVLTDLDIIPLKNILLNEKILKIFHAPQQDFEIFYRLFKQLPVNIFDTQIAAAFCGFESYTSYSELCKIICKVAIDKTQQTADWLKRPLDNNMLEYAINDVKYLKQIYNFLHLKLKLMPRLENYHQRMEKLLDIQNYKVNPAKAWEKVRFYNSSPDFINKMQMIAAFREECASQIDIPRRHFATDEDLISICQYLPTSPDQLRNLQLASYYLNKSKFQKFQTQLLELCSALQESPRR